MMNVWEATRERLDLIFREFDNVYVSFSGGKDSGVLLNMAINFIRINYPGRKLGVFHIDYEAQYKMTTEYVDAELSKNQDILEVYRICLPLAVPCCTSMSQSYWTPWDANKQDIWVRPMPENGINEGNHEFDFFYKNISDYEFQEKFSEWIHRKKGATRTACLVGIRTQESLNRWRALHSDKNYDSYQGIHWTRKMFDGVYNAYPIFDWITEDIWTANGRTGWTYNKLYDIYYQAGLTIDKMRVASPFISTAQESLKLYRIIEPDTWGKLVGRVNGVNFTGIYGGTTAMGWRSIKLPEGHTWKSYLEFLLSTLPGDTAENYKKKLETSVKFWRETGGCLSEEVIHKLDALKIPYSIGSPTNRKTDKIPVTMEYVDEIDIEEFQSIPSYKRMCICVMKNDHLCKYMGFSLNKWEIETRKNADEKYSKLKAERYDK